MLPTRRIRLAASTTSSIGDTVNVHWPSPATATEAGAATAIEVLQLEYLASKLAAGSSSSSSLLKEAQSALQAFRSALPVARAQSAAGLGVEPLNEHAIKAIVQVREERSHASLLTKNGS